MLPSADELTRSLAANDQWLASMMDGLKEFIKQDQQNGVLISIVAERVQRENRLFIESGRTLEAIQSVLTMVGFAKFYENFVQWKQDGEI